MSEYLRKYVGKYRVLAEYDLSSLDYPRDSDGKLDPSFEDLYIKCARNIKIKHSHRNILWAYIPNKTSGKNILRKIYMDYLKVDKLPSDDTYLSELCKELVDKDILTQAEVLDFEADFSFTTDKLDYMAKLLNAQKSGAKIQPYSVKNLPKQKYKIPDKDNKKYKDICKKLPQRNLKGKDIVDGIFIRQCNKEFFKNNEIRNDGRLKDKEFIHKCGLWNEYVDFLTSKEITK